MNATIGKEVIQNLNYFYKHLKIYSSLNYREETKRTFLYSLINIMLKFSVIMPVGMWCSKSFLYQIFWNNEEALFCKITWIIREYTITSLDVTKNISYRQTCHMYKANIGCPILLPHPPVSLTMVTLSASFYLHS